MATNTRGTAALNNHLMELAFQNVGMSICEEERTATPKKRRENETETRGEVRVSNARKDKSTL